MYVHTYVVKQYSITQWWSIQCHKAGLIGSPFPTAAALASTNNQVHTYIDLCCGVAKGVLAPIEIWKDQASEIARRCLHLHTRIMTQPNITAVFETRWWSQQRSGSRVKPTRRLREGGHFAGNAQHLPIVEVEYWAGASNDTIITWS